MKTRVLRKLLRRASALLFLLPIAGFANLFVNGDFDAVPIAGMGVLSSDSPPQGWKIGEGVGETINNIAIGSYLPVANSGSQFYYLGDYGQHADISQAVNLEAGHSYELKFSLASLGLDKNLNSFWPPSAAVVDLSIISDNQTLLGGLTYDYVVPSSSQRWMGQFYDFTATSSGAYNFVFTTLGEAGGFTDAAFLDSVSLIDTSPVKQNVPESGSTAALFGLSSLGLLALRRRA